MNCRNAGELPGTCVDTDETEDVLRLGLHRLTRHAVPRIRSMAGDLANDDGGTELDQGLTVLVAGLGGQLLSRA